MGCSQPTGEHARILPNGDAVAPADAPAAVKLAIAAGNLIHTLAYPEPDTHYGSLAKLWPAYDCSGATSLLLYAAHLLSPTPLDSTELENYGQPGPGHWITVYANPTHTWIVIAGIALDTANYGGPPIPAGTGPRWRREPLGNLNDGRATSHDTRRGCRQHPTTRDGRRTPAARRSRPCLNTRAQHSATASPPSPGTITRTTVNRKLLHYFYSAVVQATA